MPSNRSLPAQSTKSSSTSEKRKRRSKDPAGRTASAALPSVPSTQNLPRESLALSAFFSLHRPISITHSLPRAVTDDAFASIFVRRGRSEKMNDVISTLSQSVQELEQPMGGLNLGGHEGHMDGGEGMPKISLKNPDGSDSGVYVQLNAMSGDFLPFCPPPIPEPKSEAVGAGEGTPAESASQEAADSAAQHTSEPRRRVYKAMLTIEETVEATGEVKYMAHSSELHEESTEPRRSFLERLARRQIMFQQSQKNNGAMQAISVKRQRKLKMKKKKYKKLLKRTRNERRKLDRL
ncbi:hypothetical protein MAPG_07724 [Magnaporthiopsis poae ATCC 64411]|uniref:Small ribosomal subunit protein mS38 n=1 Tax=Magnaporthiopsis poae (strain ATCC 64411 / 73-15) TaxID=644358 RepID=A0A0C4E5F8_MAGP6|nr:hypothetical protein MAPG_07724 [Magnaporthiopsis poae ATCC 64411]